MNYIYFLTTLAATWSVGSADSKSDIHVCMIRDKIVPQLIHKPPKLICRVSYRDYGKIIVGDELPLNATEREPDVSWKARNNTLYTLYMAGMVKGQKTFSDRTTAKFKRPRTKGVIVDWEQWIVVNIPKNRACFGATVFPYSPPSMPDDISIPERYIFLIYEQRQPIDLESIKKGAKFERNPGLSKAADFAIDHDLGDPVAGNYFTIKIEKAVKKKQSPIKKGF